MMSRRPSALQGLRGAVTVIGIGAILVAIGYYTALATVLAESKAVSTSVYRSGEGDDRIAIIPVEGMITPDTAKFVHHAVEAAIHDESVKAVVLRVESGGGFVAPSEQIYAELRRLRQRREIPVVASFGGIAASGGYYVGCATEHIYAEPTGLTGSIGVMATIMDVNGLLEERLRIQPHVITATTSPQKDLANDVFEGWDKGAEEGEDGVGEDTREALRILDAMHQRFVHVVREAREPKMTSEAIAEATRGGVYMAEDAAEVKLIDEVGYLEDALAKARDLARISEDRPETIIYQPRVSLMEQLTGMGRRSARGVNLNIDPAELRRHLIEFSRPQLMYWCNLGV